MQSLITGGSGFIGGHLARVLRERGENVRVLDTRDPQWPIEDVDYLQGSITDPDTVAKAAEECDRVFHLAALAQLWLPDPTQFRRVNVDGTRNVLAAAKARGVSRVIHVSSETTLIDTRCGRRLQRIDERRQLAAQQLAGPYCASKWQADEIAIHAAESDRQDVVVCTPTVPIGPGDPWLTPPTVFLLDLLNRRMPAWMQTTLNYVDVRDIALGLAKAADQGETGKRYLLGGENLSMSELLRKLGRLSGVRMPRLRVPWVFGRLTAELGEAWSNRVSRKPPTAPRTGVRLARARTEFDNAWTRKQLDWQPRALDRSLDDALKDFRARGLWGSR